VIETEIALPEASGPVRRNLGESPIAWLAKRRGPDGKPWLSPLEAAAGERLREEFESLGTQGRLTMSWDARVDGGRTGLTAVERDHAVRTRIAKALTAVGPGLREILERVCLMGSALDEAEKTLKLPRRAGKTVLKLALQRLAQHYRMG
jgi:DNA-directed RNA polymerase specialized sigma24 family protein